MKEIIKTHNLCKQYGNFYALKDVNITVKEGDIYGLVGNNGAGKTTFLKIMTGQSNPTEGGFEMLSYSKPSDINKARRHIGALIESPSFYPDFTVRQNLEYYRIQRGIPGKDSINKALSEVNLLDAKDKKFKDLSFGMKQRLGIALAMMAEPELLILDEPINGLDPSGIVEIRHMLLKLNREKNITIIISSHILSELSAIATEYGFLKKGSLIEELSSKELQDKCKSYLEVRTNSPKKLAVILEEEIGSKDYKVMPDGSIQIFDLIDESEKICSAAVNAGVKVSEIHQKSITLESYYMSLMGGNNND